MIIIYGVYLAVVLIGNYIEAYKLKKEQIRSFMEKVGNNQSSRRSTRHTLPPPTRQRKQSISTLMDVALKAERRSVISRMGIKEEKREERSRQTASLNQPEDNKGTFGWILCVKSRCFFY
ncbi:uncharacterized protein LOC126272733 [Schistocerca gregaria]|uniref:uncharacterized protein LOC126272733 n=1 Tax=Schistocerca gregaria TaxID=7010 RepID=UPI00211E3574|nr:uncharacterized protein LOC126272733 [Schistocerca gregaria]